MHNDSGRRVTSIAGNPDSFQLVHVKIYLVGGAVRDQLIHEDSSASFSKKADNIKSDRDFVVVGATPQQLIKLGFKQVGKSFPVFLHPETKEEYALARKELKTAPGHGGFQFDFSPSITLEEDLLRRDFTVNAIAKDLDSGEIIDPFKGQQDIKDKILKHVSPHFDEDPLRVLRAARFTSQLGFQIDPTTFERMKQMTDNGDLKTLSLERVWKETWKAAHFKSFGRYENCLEQLNVARHLFSDATTECSRESQNPDTELNVPYQTLNSPEDRITVWAERIYRQHGFAIWSHWPVTKKQAQTFENFANFLSILAEINLDSSSGPENITNQQIFMAIKSLTRFKTIDSLTKHLDLVRICYPHYTEAGEKLWNLSLSVVKLQFQDYSNHEELEKARMALINQHSWK